MILVPSAARSASGNALVNMPSHPFSAAAFLLDVTAAAAGAGDTLDVYVQQSPDGTNWDDFVHFTQVLGNGGTKQFIAEWSGLAASESELHAKSDAAIVAGVLQGPKSSNWRVRWVFVGGTAAFTFAVTMSPSRLV